MAQSYFVLPILLLLHALLPKASPISGNPDSLVMFNSSVNAIERLCYTPDRELTRHFKPVELQSCNDALRLLVHQRDYTTSFRFSRNPRAQALELPRGWQLGDHALCRIIVSCENDRDTAIFRYADVAQVARRIIDHCVEKPDPQGRYPLLKWGGIEGLNGEQTFFVAVARPLRSRLETGVANGTVLTGGISVDGGIDAS